MQSARPRSCFFQAGDGIRGHCVTGVQTCALPVSELYRQALAQGWLEAEGLVDGRGTQASVIGYPHLPRTEIFRALETFYRRFYFRPRKLVALGAEMLRDRTVMKRRLGEG